MGKIFICYRRQDSQDMAGRLYDRLEARFGDGRVFKDVDSIPLAEKFPETVRVAIAECDIFLPLIGEHWLDARDAAGQRRLDDAGDYVRLEIEEALRQGVKAVPVLLHHASMPSKKDLPPACGELAEINAVRVRPDPDFKHDVNRLLENVAAVVAARERERAEEKARVERERKAQEEAERQRRLTEEREERERQAALRRESKRAAATAASARPKTKVPKKSLFVALALVAVTFSLYAVWLNRDPPWAMAPPAQPAASPAGHAAAVAAADGKTITNSIGMVLAVIPAGEFMMGSPESEPNRDKAEGPQHRVQITRPFYLGTTEVTQSQWEAVMRTTPWHGNEQAKEGPDYPANNVSSDDAVAFCQELSRRDGHTYRLPTEAEWEYACRARTTTTYSFGDDESKLGDFAWYAANVGKAGEAYAHRVGQKRPNPFGLYDMHGNVYEWCSDWYTDYYDAESPLIDPVGAPSGIVRMGRGGSWIKEPADCRSASRNRCTPNHRSGFLGFRVVHVR